MRGEERVTSEGEGARRGLEMAPRPGSVAGGCQRVEEGTREENRSDEKRREGKRRAVGLVKWWLVREIGRAHV